MPTDPMNPTFTDGMELAAWTQKIMLRDQLITETRIRALLQPKPRWLPERLWRKVIARVIALEYRR